MRVPSTQSPPPHAVVSYDTCGGSVGRRIFTIVVGVGDPQRRQEASHPGPKPRVQRPITTLVPSHSLSAPLPQGANPSYLNRVKNTLDQKSRILLINALICSHLHYCNLIWGKCSEKLQYKVQKCIKLAAKVASNGKYLKRDHVTPLLRDLKWINFNSVLRLNEASFVYINLYVSADSNVKKLYFDLRNKVSQRITRNGSDVHINYRRTAVGQKAVSVSGAKLCNSIPMNIKNLNTIVTFKSHICQHNKPKLFY